jgi:hypothetical protein
LRESGGGEVLSRSSLRFVPSCEREVCEVRACDTASGNAESSREDRSDTFADRLGATRRSRLEAVRVDAGTARYETSFQKRWHFYRAER